MLSKNPSPAELKCLNRWYPLIDHPEQLRLLESKARFKVVPAGRRSGKTERFKRFMAKTMLKNPGESYFIAAPTRPQVKKIYWEDLKLLCFTPLLPRSCVYESDLTIRLPNGSSCTLIGLDQPQRIEGTFWSGGGVDEIADVKEKAWAENISPALDTFNPQRPSYRPWCWLLGVPDGLNHYYEMAEYAQNSNDPEWDIFTWNSADILPQDIIDAAKRRLSPRQYRQEYEASFETASGKIYEDYGRQNTTDEIINPDEELLWHHDFNYTPMSSGIAVQRGKKIFILDEIILTSATAKQSALEFVEKFKKHRNKKVKIFGDPAGRAGEPHGHSSDYTDMEGILIDHGWEFERLVKRKAPAIKDRQNAVRAMICNAFEERRLFVNPKKAPYAHKGLSTTQLKDGSSFLEEVTEYQHITTAIGYMIDRLFPINAKKDFSGVEASPVINYY